MSARTDNLRQGIGTVEQVVAQAVIDFPQDFISEGELNSLCRNALKATEGGHFRDAFLRLAVAVINCGQASPCPQLAVGNDGMLRVQSDDTHSD